MARVLRFSQKIKNYESKHSVNLIRVYEIYSLLSDFYRYYLHRKYNDKTIGIELSKKFSGVVFTKNKVFIEKAIYNLKVLYKLKILEKTKDIKYNKIIINTIKNQIGYFERMLHVLNDVVKHKNIIKLKAEMLIFNNEKK